MSPKRFYGTPPPGVKAADLKGKLIVLEGADGSGRSTQIRLLTEWLENLGHATVNVGLKRSSLIGAELDRAKRGNVLGKTTMALFYATDFADQLENVMIPALRAGFVVLADRYIYTLMARDIVRGADRAWVESLYGIAPAPDLIFYLSVSPRNLVVRNLQKTNALDFWESGMDIALSRDMFESFIAYQKMVRREFLVLEKKFGFCSIDANRTPEHVSRTIRSRVQELIDGKGKPQDG